MAFMNYRRRRVGENADVRHVRDHRRRRIGRRVRGSGSGTASGKNECPHYRRRRPAASAKHHAMRARAALKRPRCENAPECRSPWCSSPDPDWATRSRLRCSLRRFQPRLPAASGRSMCTSSAATERGATRYCVPGTRGAARGIHDVLGRGREVSIQRCHPERLSPARRAVQSRAAPSRRWHIRCSQNGKGGPRPDRAGDAVRIIRTSPGSRAGRRASRSRRGAKAR